MYRSSLDYLSKINTKFFSLSRPQQVLYGFVGYVSILSSYYLYYRISEKSKAFSSYTTSEQVMQNIDLKNKCAIVTGCNTGIGKETVKQLAKHNCFVIMGCRNFEKANEAKNDILESLKNDNIDYSKNIEIVELDLSSLQSVYNFSKTIINTKKYQTIDYLINNAGIMALPKYEVTKNEKIEMQFAVNHLGHFYLTQLLLPLLKKSKTRIINVSSTGHRYCSYDELKQFIDNGIKNKVGPIASNYSAFFNYGISKSCNILFTRELHTKYFYNYGIVSVAVHPGIIKTELGRNVTSSTLSAVYGVFKMMYMFLFNSRYMLKNVKSLSQGSATTLRCVAMTDDEIESGHFYYNCNESDFELFDACKRRTYDNYEENSLESKLWKLSEILIQKNGFKLEISE